MRNPSCWISGAASAAALMVSGCASVPPPPVAVQCPKFQPSPEALAPIKGPGWMPLAGRVVEHFRDGATISPPP